MGVTFGFLEAIEEAEPLKGRRRITCRCVCEAVVTVYLENLSRGITASCGCKRTEIGKKVRNYLDTEMKVDGVVVPNLLRKVRSDSHTGIKGVGKRYTKSGNTIYVANIRIKGKMIYLGRYSTLEEAAAARRKAEDLYHQPYIDALAESRSRESDGKKEE